MDADAATPVENFPSCSFTENDDCSIDSLVEDAINVIYPGGATRCYYETVKGEPNPYFFQVQKGKNGNENKLHIHFQGGGGCSTAKQCQGLEMAEPIPTVMDTGIFSLHRDDNPFADWTQVAVNLCSGDVHIGNATNDDDPLLEWRGRVNARTVLEWTAANIVAPERLLLTGCSAGSFGLQYWSNTILHHYKEALAEQGGTLMASVVMGGWMGLPLEEEANPWRNWSFCSQPDFNWSDQTQQKCLDGTMETADVNLDYHQQHKDTPFAYLSYKSDPVQRSYLCFERGCTQGKNYGDMKDLMRRYTISRDAEAGGNNNVVSYFLNFKGHCVLPDDTFFEAGADSLMFDPAVSVKDWVEQLAYREESTVIQSQCRRAFVSFMGQDYTCDASLTGATFSLSSE